MLAGLAYKCFRHSTLVFLFELVYIARQALDDGVPRLADGVAAHRSGAVDEEADVPRPPFFPGRDFREELEEEVFPAAVLPGEGRRPVRLGVSLDDLTAFDGDKIH